jgi:hypothetical protein
MHLVERVFVESASAGFRESYRPAVDGGLKEAPRLVEAPFTGLICAA